MSRIKSLRKQKPKITQVDLARVSEVGQSMISRLENHQQLNPSYDTLEKLASAFAKFGRKVDALDLHPRRSPALVKGARVDRRKRRAS